MSKIIQPVTQKWLTNVATVSLDQAGDHFEIACYCSKIVSFKGGLETDLSEVLQTATIFSDVKRGLVHSADKLHSVFGTTNTNAIASEILLRGRVQLSNIERGTEQERTIAEIANIICQRIYNPLTGTVFPQALIQDTIKDTLHYRLTNQSVSQQAAAVIRMLADVVSIGIRNIPILIDVPVEDAKGIIELGMSRFGLRFAGDNDEGNKDNHKSALPESQTYTKVTSNQRDTHVHGAINTIDELISFEGHRAFIACEISPGMYKPFKEECMKITNKLCNIVVCESESMRPG